MKINPILTSYADAKNQELDKAFAQLAAVVLAYYNELRKQGANRREALYLAAEYQKAMLEAGMKEART